MNLGDNLTDRERQVLNHIADGQSLSEIAGALYISASTVKQHACNVYVKLGARNAAHAVAIASRAGILGGAK